MVHLRTAMHRWQLQQPAANNYLHIDGKTNLEAAYETFINKVLVSVCPGSVSPSNELAMDEVRGFMLETEAVNGFGEQGVNAPMPPVRPCHWKLHGVKC